MALAILEKRYVVGLTRRNSSDEAADHLRPKRVAMLGLATDEAEKSCMGSMASARAPTAKMFLRYMPVVGRSAASALNCGNVMIDTLRSMFVIVVQENCSTRLLGKVHPIQRAARYVVREASPTTPLSYPEALLLAANARLALSGYVHAKPHGKCWLGGTRTGIPPAHTQRHRLFAQLGRPPQ